VAVGAGGEGAGAGRCAAVRRRFELGFCVAAGIRPVARRRWELRLPLAEQEEISRGLAAGLSSRAIAEGLPVERRGRGRAWPRQTLGFKTPSEALAEVLR
jgi:hypothetical protein